MNWHLILKALYHGMYASLVSSVMVLAEKTTPPMESIIVTQQSGQMVQVFRYGIYDMQGLSHVFIPFQ